MENSFVLGFIKGEKCNRDGCEGIIDEHEKAGCCSCHINPPCSYCVDACEYCPVCGWEGIEEQKKPTPFSYSDFIHYHKQQNEIDERRKELRAKMRGEIPVDKIDYEILGHRHFSQICEGVYPVTNDESADIKAVLEKVKGTFGGRFERFGKGTFKYIAYTD